MSTSSSITTIQLARLIPTIIVGGWPLVLPSYLVQVAKQDIWFAFIFSSAYGFFLIFMFYMLSKTYPKQHIFEISNALCGKILGTLINAVLIILIFIALVRDLSEVSIFIQTSLLPATPIEFIIFLQLIVVLYFGRHAIQTTFMINDVFFIVTFTVSVIILPFVLIGQFYIVNLQPIFELSLMNWINSNLVMFEIFSDLIVIGAFLHMIKTPQIGKAMRTGLTFTPFYLVIWIVFLVGVISPITLEKLAFPLYALVKLAKISEFLDRMDILFFSLWFPIFILKFVFLFHALHIGIKHFVRNQQVKVINRPLTLFIYLSGIILFSNYDEVYTFTAYGFFHTIIIQSTIFTLWAIFFFIKKRKSIPGLHLSQLRASSQNLNMVTIGIYVAATVFILCGMYFGDFSHILANIFAFLYFAALTIAYYINQVQLNKSPEGGSSH
ncbi:GerAB/ArcD/ProY family transporter [Longirhabdus pacifica]|uniref:GerAB/ArcD/ProY family transporter n=1 Tax=Longirhabdus pacifica TaxID=2305227 RepID=UPI0010090AF3|nr:endospore germination permease [Longirhabdus pacifica]